ncbi:MAG: hypothetical protein AAFN30_02030 [Actinomycetota bacterium]
MPRLLLALVVAVLLLATACSADGDPEEATDSAAESDEGAAAESSSTTAAADPDADGEPLFPDVVSATAQLSADGTWEIAATVSSPYDSPERYADAWRVIGSDGTVYGVRELAHDHAAEQPFTRRLTGVEIPDGEDEITIEGRDQVSGWGGQKVTIPLER